MTAKTTLLKLGMGFVDDSGSGLDAYLLYRDGNGKQQIAPLGSGSSRLTIGRDRTRDIQFSWDNETSRLHAVLERVGEDWILSDDGLSSNGTFVNGQRLTGRRWLRDGDVVLIGGTSVTYRDDSSRPAPSETNVSSNTVTLLSLSPTQRVVLEALCRPYNARTSRARPATNQEIGAELFLSVDAVKIHIRALFAKFGIENLPQNQKRAKLVELAFLHGLISDRDI